ncbi:MAG: hypothetical protein J0I17_04420 ['Candidatus Kapabacteria' thiocyanatum]|nr:hypothetical protein ['Candidatus Kapabacteria' thiocyanatum]
MISEAIVHSRPGVTAIMNPLSVLYNSQVHSAVMENASLVAAMPNVPSGTPRIFSASRSEASIYSNALASGRNRFFIVHLVVIAHPPGL